jgi:hypothetical protein
VFKRRKANTPSNATGSNALHQPKPSRKSRLLACLKRKKQKKIRAHLQKNIYVSRNEANLPSGLVKCSPDADVVIHTSNVIDMRSGDLLVAAKRPLVIRAGASSVLVSKGAIVLVSQRAGIAKVNNLSESKLNSARVVVDGTLLPVKAGQEYVIADDFDSLQKSVEEDNVHRRALHTFELPGGVQLMSCEYEPVTLIKHNDLLSSMIHTSNRTDKQVFNKIIKMAACLQIATASHGQYSPLAQDYATAHTQGGMPAPGSTRYGYSTTNTWQ